MSKTKTRNSSFRFAYFVLVTLIILCLLVLVYLVGIMFSDKFVKKTMSMPILGTVTEFLVGNLYGEDTSALKVSSDSTDVKPKKDNAEGESLPTYGELQETDLCTNAYLNNCCFLGDSRTVAMVKYGYVDESQTLAEVGLAHMNAESNVYTYKSGLQYTFDSFLDYYSKDIIYISYGVNGINFADEVTYETSYEKLIDHVISSCPNSKIVIQSIWPVREGYVGAGNITNAAIDYYNDYLRRLADDKGLYYLDTQSVLKDEYNQMKQEYNDGDGLHYAQEGYEAVMQYMLSHPVPGYEVYQ